MSFTPHSRRFDRRWLFPPIETEDDETSDAPEFSPFYSNGELTSDVTDRDIDLALQHVTSERFCVCPLCGALVGNDGFVLN